MSSSIAFLSGIVVGGICVGIFFFVMLWVVLEYQKHPEWFDEYDD